jgi:hypothetical protein
MPNGDTSLPLPLVDNNLPSLLDLRKKFPLAIPAPGALGPLASQPGPQSPDNPRHPADYPLGLSAPAPTGDTSLAGQVESERGKLAGLPAHPQETIGWPRKLLGGFLEMSRDPSQSALGYRIGHPEAMRIADERKAGQAEIGDIGVQSEVALREAEAERARRETPGKEEQWSEMPGALGPQGEPVQQEAHSGQVRVVSTPGVTMREPAAKQERVESKELEDPKDRKRAIEAVFDPTGKGVYRDTAGNVIQNPRPFQKPERPPSEPGNYKEVYDPSNPNKVIGWVDPKSRNFVGVGEVKGLPTSKGAEGKPPTISAKSAGQTKSRADAAAAIMPLLDRVDRMLKDPEIVSGLGPMPGRISDVERWIGNAPPKIADLYGTLKSIYSLAGAMHSWRAIQVAQEFEKAYGGLKSNPATLSSALNGLRETAKSISTVGGYGGQGLPQKGDVDDGWKFNGGDPAEEKNWEKINAQR